MENTNYNFVLNANDENAGKYASILNAYDANYNLCTKDNTRSVEFEIAGNPETSIIDVEGDLERFEKIVAFVVRISPFSDRLEHFEIAWNPKIAEGRRKLKEAQEKAFKKQRELLLKDVLG